MHVKLNRHLDMKHREPNSPVVQRGSESDPAMYHRPDGHNGSGSARIERLGAVNCPSQRRTRTGTTAERNVARRGEQSRFFLFESLRGHGIQKN